MQSEMTTLANGLRVITSTRTHTETVTLGIWINTGAACETEDTNGISHFLEHMVFQGTTNRTALQISEEIEDVGGQSNAYTSREFTSFYAKMLKEDTELAVDIISDLVLNSTFPEEELTKEREVVVQEIKQSIDAPDDIIFDYLQEQAFPDQALGRTILGPAELVRSFNQSTLRTYLKNNYAAENMVVCAVGNIEHNAFVKMVEKRMLGLQSKKNFIKEDQIYKGGFYKDVRDIEQAHITLGFQGVNYLDKQYYPSIILSTIFGGGMTSRLFQEIREKRGLVYTTYSFANSHSKNGLFGIYAGTGKEELKTLMPVVCEEIKKISQDKVSDKELQRAKIGLKASMLMSLESSSSSSEILARQELLFNRRIPVSEMITKIENVTADDILSVASKIFSSDPTYCLVGDIDSYLEMDELQKQIRV